MISTTVKSIMLRVIEKRLLAGERFEEIIRSYPRLSEEDRQELLKELEVGRQN